MIKNCAKPILVLAAALVALAGATAVGCSHDGGPEVFQGIVEFDDRALGFEQAGRLDRLYVSRGDEVLAGASLAALDDGLPRLARDRQKAEAQAATARADLLRAGVRGEDERALSAQLDALHATEANARKTVERNRALVEKSAVPVAIVDRDEAELKRIEGERRAAQERLQAMHKGARPQELAAAEASRDAALAGLAAEELRLVRTQLVAPIAGRVLDIAADPGEIVGAGTAIVVLADTRHPFVDVFVPQGRTAGISIGTKAAVRVDALSDALTGDVEDVGRRTEFTPRYLFSDRERPNLVVRVRIRIADPEERLLAGLPARVVIDGDTGPRVAATGSRP